MPPLKHGQYPAVPEVSVTATPAAPSLFSSGATVNVVNKSLFPMICRFEANSATESRALDPEFVWIDAETAAELNLRVPLRLPPARSVAVRAHHPATVLRSETVVRAPLALAGALVLLLLALAGGTGFALSHRAAVVPAPQGHVPLRVTGASVASVGSLSVEPPVATAGSAIHVQYASSGSSGTVRLIDEKGITRVAQAWSRQGETVLKAPHVSTRGRFTVALAVTAGKSTASAQAALLIVPEPRAAQRAVPASVATAGMPAAVHVQTEPSYLASGEHFRVVVTGAHANEIARIVLQRSDGMAVAAHDAADSEMLFAAPVVSRTERFFVVVTLTQNRPGGVIVQPVDVHARPVRFCMMPALRS